MLILLIGGAILVAVLLIGAVATRFFSVGEGFLFKKPVKNEQKNLISQCCLGLFGPPLGVWISKGWSGLLSGSIPLLYFSADFCNLIFTYNLVLCSKRRKYGNYY